MSYWGAIIYLKTAQYVFILRKYFRSTYCYAQASYESSMWGSFYTGTCSLVIMAVKHTSFRVKLLNQYQRNLEKNPYCTVCYTSKKRVTLVTGNHIFWIFRKKFASENFWKVCGHCRCPAINQIEINTCTLISTLCELFLSKITDLQFFRKIVSLRFTSFFRNFWTEKKKPQTFSPFGQMKTPWKNMKPLYDFMLSLSSKTFQS